jgi:DNA-binding beta-propeller fold protein YncE
MKAHLFWKRAVLALSLGLLCQTAQAFTNMATGVAGGIGIAADPSGSAVYYVEFGGALKRIRLTPPGCTAATPCPIDTVASGFSHPEDVALDTVHNLAYVTTRDDPGTTGALWSVDLTTGVRTLIAFNLGAPQQIVLDVPTNSAYIVGFDIGRLWKVQLDTGSKTTLMSGLGHPVGVAVTADRARAYVTEQSPSRLALIDLATHTRISNVATGLTSPFFLQWTDPAQTALFLVQRDPVNNVLRFDVPSSIIAPVITGLPVRPSAIAVNALAGVAYVATNDFVVRVDLNVLPMAEPVFLAVGNVPSTSIIDGYATTTPGYWYQVKDSPFGGTLNIFGNLSNFKSLGATHYRVKVSKDGGAPTTLTNTWTTGHWNPVTSVFESAPIAPIPGDDRYLIPAEYPTFPQRWSPPFLMMRWPSSVNGMYTFSVEIWQLSGAIWTNLTALLPPAKNQLTLLIDNDPPDVDLLNIYWHNDVAHTSPIPACTIVKNPPFTTNVFDFQLRAYDANGHLLSYTLTGYWGHNLSGTVIPTDSYSSHINADGLHLWRGQFNLIGPLPAGWAAPCNCAYTFFVGAWKRTIDGYSYLSYREAHQSITIDNTGIACP